MYFKIEDEPAFAAQLGELSRGADETFLILLPAAEAGRVPELVSALNERDVPFFGAVFKAVHRGGERFEAGAVVLALPLDGAPCIARAGDTVDWAAALPAPGDFDGPRTLFAFGDGESAAVAPVMEGLFESYGSAVGYFGGGAGGDGAPAMVFGEAGAFEQAAVIALARVESAVAVRSGADADERQAALGDLSARVDGRGAPDLLLALDSDGGESACRLPGLLEAAVDARGWPVVSEGAEVAAEMASDGSFRPALARQALAVGALWAPE